MPAIHHGDLLTALGEVLEEAKFVVTPDQFVRAQAILLHLGADRSPSGLVALLSPIFCDSTDQQEQFAQLFIRAMDLSAAGLSIGSPENTRVLGRRARPAKQNFTAIDRDRRKARAAARLRRPKLVLAAFEIVAALVGLWFAANLLIGKMNLGSADAAAHRTDAIEHQRESIPKKLPPIEGHGTLEIRVGPSGREEVTESLFAKSPWAASAALLLVAAGIAGIGLRRRPRPAPAPPDQSHSVTPELPKTLRYGRRSAMAAANRLLTPMAARVGNTIDVGASIRRHVRLGYWDGLTRSHPSHPAYLALTRLPTASDARSLVTDSLIGELENLGVPIDTYYFDDDPRRCRAKGSGRLSTVRELARQRPDDHLLVFGDGFDLAARDSVFRAWQWRRLVSPATLDALAKLDVPKDRDDSENLGAPPDWSLDVPPSEIADRLEAWLGAKTFQWLATCAIYSEFNGAMLLYLGEMPELGELTEADLERVLSLPLVTAGSIPEPLRLELLDRLEPAISEAARLRIVDLLRDRLPTGDTEADETFKVELAAQRWLATGSSADRASFADAVRESEADPIHPGSALFEWTEEAMPYWTLRRRRALVKWASLTALGLLGIAAFIPMLPGRSSSQGIGPQPLGADFGDWNCFTKVEQTLDWRLPPGTEVNSLSVTGYDQSAPNEGFHLLAQSAAAIEVTGPHAAKASLEFAPLHAKQYTGVLTVGTNRGTFRFGLRGTGVYGGDNCVDEGHGELGLESDFNGNGCNQITENHGAVTALLAPARPSGPADTHSALVLGPWWQGDFDLQCGVRTIAQLRDPAPNAWEVGWLIWGFADLQHFYYIALKSNGWELGRKEGPGPKDQRFLATKDTPVFLPGRRYMIHVTRHGDELSIEVDGTPLVTIKDTDHPVTSGRVGFYSECAVSKFDSLQIH